MGCQQANDEGKTPDMKHDELCERPALLERWSGYRWNEMGTADCECAERAYRANPYTIEDAPPTRFPWEAVA